MNPGGVVIILAGVWVLTQVLGGNALKRLGIIEDAQDAALPSTPGSRGSSGLTPGPSGGNGGGGVGGGGGGDW